MMAKACLVFVCVLVASGAALSQRAPGKQIKETHELLQAWQISDAQKLLVPLQKTFADEPAVQVLEGIRRFFESDYEGALKVFRKLKRVVANTPAVRYYASMAAAAWERTRKFKRYRSAKGHFEIRYQPGLDEVLLHHTGDALERGYLSLGRLFQYYPKAVVVVEILPSIEDLAAVTPLKLSEITASGTIAICKFNRIMIVSPRALVHGYNWLDTVVHEYVHYIVTKKTKNRVPIWLHEGLAKFFENRWREETRAVLSAIHEHLLAEAISKRRLITFAKMSPSIAKLATNEEATLAFAEVFTAIQYLHRRGGTTLIRKLLDAMTSGLSDRQAIKKVVGVSFGVFYQEWRRYVQGQGYQMRRGMVVPQHLFRGKNRKSDELKLIAEKSARRLTYLGDLLRVRRRYRAAAKEYRKAIGLVGARQPTIQSKLAAAYLALKDLARVIEVLGNVERDYPDYFLINYYLGKAYYLKKDWRRAQQYLLRAVRRNPFDADVQRMLATVYGELRQAPLAAIAKRHYEILRRHDVMP